MGHRGILSPLAPFFFLAIREGTKGSTIIVFIVFKHEMVTLVSSFTVFLRYLSRVENIPGL